MAKTISEMFAQRLEDMRSTTPLEEMFEEIPVPLDVFVEDKAYLNNFPLSPIQYDIVQHIERVYLPETYPLLEEVSEYWKSTSGIPIVNQIPVMMGKGCIAPYEEVYDAVTGSWTAIQDMKETYVSGIVDVDDNYGTSHTSGNKISGSLRSSTDRMFGKAFKRGHGRMLRIKTDTGSSIDVYEGHLFVSWKSNDVPYKHRYVRSIPVWKSAGELRPGDKIGLLSKLSCLDPEGQDSREVELLGRWLGATYPKIPKAHPLFDILKKYNLKDSFDRHKKIPKEFFKLPDGQVALLLSSIFDAGGDLLLDDFKKSKIEFYTKSEDLVIGVSRLLLRLGVVSNISHRAKTYTYGGQQKYARKIFRLTISDPDSLISFLATIRFSNGKEIERLRYIEIAKREHRSTKIGDVYWAEITSVEELGHGDYWDMTVPEMGTYVAGSSSFINSNSGKDHLCRIATLRVIYLLMCLKSPQEYFGKQHQDTIHCLNVAVSSRQALTAFFKPMTRLVKNGWFSSRSEATKNAIVFDKNIESISGHSDAESQEGLNLILGVADEIDGFPSADERSVAASGRIPMNTAEGILNMMKSSGNSRFSTYKNIQISFPRYLGSTIMRLVEEGKKDMAKKKKKSIYYAVGPYSTWEVNPSVPGPERFKEEYEADPVEARAKYECKPTHAAKPYYRNTTAFEAVFYHGPKRLEVVDYVREKNSWKPVYNFHPEFQPIEGANYAIHGDMAKIGDRAGIAMSHIVRYEEIEKDVPESELVDLELRPVFKTDFVIWYESDISSDPAREIQLRWFRELIGELRLRGFNITFASHDNWQSTDSLQIITNDYGIETKRISTDIHEEPWRNLRDLVHEGRVEIPFSELLKKELFSLTRNNKGKIDHLPNGSKDCADALACSLVGAIQAGGEENPEGKVAKYAGHTFEVGSDGDIALAHFGVSFEYPTDLFPEVFGGDYGYFPGQSQFF